jgi:hypothetical protein
MLTVPRFAILAFNGEVERGSRGRRLAGADRLLGTAGFAGAQDTSAA